MDCSRPLSSRRTEQLRNTGCAWLQVSPGMFWEPTVAFAIDGLGRTATTLCCAARAPRRIIRSFDSLRLVRVRSGSLGRARIGLGMCRKNAQTKEEIAHSNARPYRPPA